MPWVRRVVRQFCIPECLHCHRTETQSEGPGCRIHPRLSNLHGPSSAEYEGQCVQAADAAAVHLDLRTLFHPVVRDPSVPFLQADLEFKAS